MRPPIQIVCAAKSELPHPLVPSLDGQCAVCDTEVWRSATIEWPPEAEPVCITCATIEEGDELLATTAQVQATADAAGVTYADVKAHLSLFGITIVEHL